jgi:hypothetical protein
LDSKHNIIKLEEEHRILNNHLLAKVFKIYHTRETKVDQVEMLDAKITLANITNKLPNT